MFTGLVHTVAELVGRSVDGGGGRGKLTLRLKDPWRDPVRGESVAVNGCCLSMERCEHGNVMSFHVLEETLRCTNLGVLPPGAALNVERALRLGDRVGGHLVSGHIDCTGRILSLNRNGGDFELRVSFPPELRQEIAVKGSIAVDGVSLTVAAVNDAENWFAVRLIPLTIDGTALTARKPGEMLNLESDMLGKYVARRLRLNDAGQMEERRKVSMDVLREAGFL